MGEKMKGAFIAILWLVVLIRLAIKSASRKKEGNGEASADSQNASGMGNVSRQQTTGQMAGSVYKAPSSPPVQTRRTAEPVKAAQNTIVSKPQVAEKKQSTIEYLNQKAKHDAEAHRREAMEEERRRRQESSIPIALRYTGFETVAPTDKIVICGYCRAENMVPKNIRSKYRCYFCRENL